MTLIVVAGTENASASPTNPPSTVAVVDASNPASPVVTMLQPNIGLTGARVAIDGGLLAVGAVLSGTVKLFDVTKPTVPTALGSVATSLSGGIGAIAVRGTQIAVGEWTNSFGARVALIDGSGGAPAVLSTATTPIIGNAILGQNEGDPLNPLAAITSVAFLSNTIVIAASPSSGQIILIDFSDRLHPAVTPKTTSFASIGSADADADAQQIAAGDGAAGQVRQFDSGVAAPQTQNTSLVGIGSVSLSAPLAIAGSPAAAPTSPINVALVDFSVPSVTPFDAQLNGGATAVMRDQFIAFGSILGPFGQSLGRIEFFDAAATATPLGHADVALASISTIAIGQTTDVTASPNPQDFGIVAAAGTSIRSVGLKNTGSIARRVTAAAIGGATGSGTFAFMAPFVPPSPMAPIVLAANGTATISILYTGGAGVGPAGADLSLTTDDPAAPHIAVSLTGRVGNAVAALSAPTLDFGAVAACKTEDLSVSLLNTGNLPLSVTAITIAGDARLTYVGAPPTVAKPLVVAPGGSQSVTVHFNPAGVLGAIAAGASLTFTCNDPAAPTLSLTGSAVASPPALVVSAASLAFGTIPVNSKVALRLTLSNGSACEILNAVVSTAAPFSVEANTLTTSFVLSGARSRTIPINPGDHAELAIAFSPPTVGNFADTLTITHNDPVQPTVTLPLTGAAVAAPPTALELVLDRSGSMQDPVAGGTKMTSLQQTVGLFAEIIPFGNGDELGVVMFDSTASVLTPRATWTATQQSTVTSAVNALVPTLATSIGAGLDSARTDLATSVGTRRAILVFTDGMENTAPMIAQILPSITQAGIEVYAVGLGRPADISTAALSALAVDSHGKFFNTADVLVLRKQFLQVLADSFRQNVAADPITTLKPAGTADLLVNLTRCDRSVTFTASWDDPASALSVTLLTPQGAVLNPSSPATNRLVEFGQGATYAWYRVRFAPLDPGSGQFLNPAPAGLWQLHVRPTSLAATSERVAMSALVESDLMLTVDIRATDTASPIVISAALLDGVNPVPGAHVEARVTPPTGSLAAASTPAVVANALTADAHPRRLRPTRSARSTKQRMAYSARSGRYATQVRGLTFDGVYQIEVVASGIACGGNFDRYATYTVYVAPRASGSSPPIGVTPGVPGTAVVTVTPTAAGGQLLGPGFSHLVAVTVSGKGAISDAIDLGNGTYAFRAYWNPRLKNPTVTVAVAGKRRTVSLSKPLKPVGRRRATPSGKRTST